MHNSERKTIFNVLALYLASTFLIVFAFTYSYYLIEKSKINNEIKNKLHHSSKIIFNELEINHNKLAKEIIYPRYDDFQSAIYDIDKNIIFGTFNDNSIDFAKSFYFRNGFYYYIFATPQYYLGAAYIVIKEEGISPFDKIFNEIILILLIIFFIIILTSLFLVKLILKPIRDNLSLLDRFIKDTTHELNTPVSTILTNIELLQKSPNINQTENKKIARLKSAALTITNIYEDLVYLTLNQNLKIEKTNVNINKIIEERVDYFASIFSSKQIEVQIIHNKNAYLSIDIKKFQRVIDNLLSNAKKYSPKNSQITIIIDKNNFLVCDRGQGMTKEQIKRIHERYTRFDTTQGGFGIGFNIIYNIAKEYNLNIKIDSVLNEGTCINISWQ